ncbi:hypothetical protein [Thermococcus sp. MAR1]|uniref:hypothetical protein n=1 Tax=Thermococcus sp. MAR1 TaxID=1638263 RepID=UPI00143A3133|nr:hypothetical protein [Thermococcus sp. MAR1]NJE11248.1 hypothetical protein [Thermococcus sp. MAR1]
MEEVCMRNTKAILLALMIAGMVIASGCMGEGTTTGSPSPTTSSQPSTTQPETTTTQEPSTWEMKAVWSADTTGIPFMDMSPDGSLSAAIDWNRGLLYLVKPDGSNTTLNLRRNSGEIGPVVSSIAVVGDQAWVLASYGGFAGIRIFSWNGFVGEERHGGAGAVADYMLRSPSGNHLCYLVTVSPTEQELHCDGEKITLTPDDYDLKSISDSGLVVLSEKERAFVFKDGERILTFNTSRVIAYRDKLLVSEDGKLKVFSGEGKLLAEGSYPFDQTVLLKWTLIPTGRYLLWHEPLGDTHVLTWNLTEVKVLPGFPYFANENFAVTAKDGVIHCYSLGDFHEVFSVKIPGDSLGYIKLSDDGKVMLISGETGNFWLYRAENVMFKYDENQSNGQGGEAE